MISVWSYSMKFIYLIEELCELLDCSTEEYPLWEILFYDYDRNAPRKGV